MRDRIIAKVLRWLFFTVVVSCLPLVATYRNTFLHSVGTPGFGVITEHGEVYLLSSAFCATSVGELVGSGTKALALKIIVGGFAVSLVILCGLSYVSGTANITPSKADFDIATQFLALLASVVVSTGCIATSEVL